MAEMKTTEEFEDDVAEKWDETRMSEKWLAFFAHINETDQLVCHMTQHDFRKGDAYLAISQLAMFIGRENGHSDEYLVKFREQLIRFIWQTVGRLPAPEPLPLAKHLQVEG